MDDIDSLLTVAGAVPSLDFLVNKKRQWMTSYDIEWNYIEVKEEEYSFIRI